tara:strand:- start:1501 stop:1962 length:462 start_codon:yes stop_codon:yes gene_type:complete
MIKLKFNINFDKLKNEFESKKVNESININLSSSLATTLQHFIQKKNNGLEPLSPTQKNVRRFKHSNTDTRPLFLSGTLHDSLKGSKQGLRGVDYIKQHATGYDWSWDHPDKQMKNPKVPARNIADGYTKKDADKNVEDFKKDFVKLLNKAIRK